MGKTVDAGSLRTIGWVPVPPLKTLRLLLRQWRDEDLPIFAAMNADPQVMEFFPTLLDRQASDELAFTIRANLNASLFGLRAVEILDVARFAGFIGLSVPRLEVPFMPTVEISWRLSQEYWGKGYATEGAQAVLKYGFEVLKLPEIIAFTAAINLRSIRVMQRIGMKHSVRDNFDHSEIPSSHLLRPHVLYRAKFFSHTSKNSECSHSRV